MKHILLSLLATLALTANGKVALVIGNSNYQHLNKLSSPSQDIPALASKLRKMGFEVVELYNQDEKSMKKAIKDFKTRLLQNKNAIALFYYSGHGSQAYGESYLIPIDGDTRDESDVDADGIKVETIAQKMATARTKANILFLDACRDVPTGTMGGTKGLGQVKRQPSSTLILYSTSKNRTAKDDRVFNRVVLSKLGLNLPFIAVANDISYTVSQKTGGKQTPELLATGGLPSFVLGGYVAPPPTPRPTVKPIPKIITHSTKGITTINGKMWQDEPKNMYLNWNDAIKYCEGLKLDGYRDWKLPSKEVLENLYENKSKLKNISAYYYWSSTTYVSVSSYAWDVNFYDGGGYWHDKGDKYRVRCVRGGQ